MKRLGKISENNLLLLLSLGVGICAGLAAVLLERGISLIQTGLMPWMTSPDGFAWGRFVLPGAGMLLTLLFVRFLVRDNIGHGVTKVLLSLSREDARIHPHNMGSSLVASALTIGFGGSVGAEAPIVYTGAALGSNFGRAAGLSQRGISILVGCGAAGAVSGIFGAPLAGVLFTLEVLMFNLSMSSLMPLLLSTVSAAVVVYLYDGGVAKFACDLTPFQPSNIPFYIALGIICGLISLYFMHTALALEDRLARLRGNFWRWLVCALSLGLLIFLFPPLFGEGYDSLRTMLGSRDIAVSGPLPLPLSSPWSVPAFFALVLLLKVFAMTFTNAGGGVGGTFGPTLIVGGLAGFVLSRSLNLLLAGTGIVIPEHNFVLVGMAGLMAGVMQAPMTAIFLIAEITGGYELLLPLILCSTVSFGTIRIREKYSIYSKRIAQSGDLMTHDNDHSALMLIKTAQLVRDKYPHVSAGMSLRELVALLSGSTAAVYPVLDRDGRFVAQVEVEHIRKIVFRTELYDRMFVRDLMEKPPFTVGADERMEAVMEKFAKSGSWRLPVLDAEGRYLGFISKSRVLEAYREALREISRD